MSYNFSEAAMREGRGSSSSLRKMSFNVILLGKNDCDRKSLCNFFAKNCSYKSFDVKTQMISFYLLAQSQQLLNHLLSCLLLNKFLTCCNFPSIVVMMLKLSTSTGNKSQPRGYVLIESKNKFWGTFSFKMGVRKRVKSRSSPYKNADIISFYYPQT